MRGLVWHGMVLARAKAEFQRDERPRHICFRPCKRAAWLSHPRLFSEVFAMSKPSIIAFALMTGFGISATTFAQRVPPADATRAGQPAQPSASIDHPIIKPGDRNCLRETGSLIRVKKGECLPVTGRSYSGEELRRTGHPDTARALQMLDPSVNVGH
jgi:hypothetical protein